MLFLFFALESLLGDKSEGLKAAGLAFRRAMLSIATTERFAHPDRMLLLYDRVRSAAVHGEQVPEVTWDLVSRLAWDIRLAMNEYLDYAEAEGHRKRSQVRKALMEHAEAKRLAEWLRERGGPEWRDFLDKNFPCSDGGGVDGQLG
jgi:hypothetical protein